MGNASKYTGNAIYCRRGVLVTTANPNTFSIFSWSNLSEKRVLVVDRAWSTTVWCARSWENPRLSCAVVRRYLPCERCIEESRSWSVEESGSSIFFDLDSESRIENQDRDRVRKIFFFARCFRSRSVDRDGRSRIEIVIFDVNSLPRHIETYCNITPSPVTIIAGTAPSLSTMGDHE